MKAPDPRRVPVRDIDWPAAARLIPARYEAAACFERLTSADAILAMLADLADLTAGPYADFTAMDPARVLFGPGAGWINASFILPRPGRFSTSLHGAFYGAGDLETAIAEVRHHLGIDYRREGIAEAQDLEYRALKVRVLGPLHDLRGVRRERAPWAAIHDPDSYAASQAFAARLRETGSGGVAWTSVRRPPGACCAVFDPNHLRACRHDTYLTFRWNGREVSRIYERRILDLGPEA